MYYLIGWINCGHGISAGYRNEGEAFARWYKRKHKLATVPWYELETHFCAGSSTHEHTYKIVNAGVITDIDARAVKGIMLKGMYDPAVLLKRIGPYLTHQQRTDFVDLFINHNVPQQHRLAVQVRHYAYN